MDRQLPNIGMEETVLVRGARQVLTLHGPSGPRRGAALGDLGVISDGAVLIRNGRVLEAGPSRRVENVSAARKAREINAAGRVVMPGFVDSHAQIILPHAHPDEQEAAAGQPERLSTSTKAEQFWRGAREIRATPASRLEMRARDVIAGMARHGTTALEAKSGFALDRFGEFKILRVLARLTGHPLDIVAAYSSSPFTPPQFGENAAAYVEWLCAEVFPSIARRKLARFAEVNCSESPTPVEVVRRYLECLQKLGFPLKVHSGPRTSVVRLAVEMSAVAVALDRIEERDIPALAKSGTMATLMPAAMPAPGWYGQRDRYAPARALIEAGAAVTLASGYSPNQRRTYNMQMVIALACSEMGMSAAEAISAATINGAHAIGLGGETGSLAPGKRADLVLLNVEDYREIPHFVGVNHVHMVLKNGVTIFQEGGVASWTAR